VLCALCLPPAGDACLKYPRSELLEWLRLAVGGEQAAALQEALALMVALSDFGADG
jgi:hypothetical protein